MEVTADFQRGGDQRGARGHGRHAWTDFKSWSEDDAVFVLFPAGPQFFAFPKRAFSPSDEAAFRACLIRSGLARARLLPV